MTTADQSDQAAKHVVTVQKIDGVWWFVDPNGEPFISLGVNHVQADCWLAPYNHEHSLQSFGGDLATSARQFNPDGQGIRRLMDWVKRRMGDMHFNTLGIHTYGIPAEAYSNDFYYCIAIEAFPLGSRYRFDEQTFPDIFSAEFERLLEEKIKSICRIHRHSRKLIGYAFSDIPRWYFFENQERADPSLHPWVSDILGMPSDSLGKQMCLACFQKRYPSVRAFADEYAITVKTWDDVCKHRTWIVKQPTWRIRQDGEALLSMFVERWYSLHSRLIRKHDPDHLLLGDKLHSPHQLPAWFIDILRRWVDVVFIQWYRHFEDQAETLTQLHRQTGRPILNGDSCFSCVKPPEQTQVKGLLLSNQSEVGQAYHDYLRNLCSEPYMVGWHHCGFVEQWDGGKSHDWEINENGFFDPFMRPHASLVERVSTANAQARLWHQKATHRPGF